MPRPRSSRQLLSHLAPSSFYSFYLSILVLTLVIALPAKCLADTHDAFERLLDLPQALVGAAADPANRDPKQVVDEHGEAKLVQWLDEHPNLELNRYEHQGTLLQHAVRADLKALTIWLLAHGADPTTPLPVYGDPHMDSLGIALKMQHWDIVDVLLGLPVYKKLTPVQLTERYMPFAPDALDQLLARRFALPNNAMAACLLTVQLQNVAIKQALEVPADHVGVIGKNSTDAWCKRLPNQPTKVSPQAFDTLDWQAWNSLDSRIKDPVFKFLLATPKTPQDVQALFASTLRKPSDTDLADAIRPWVAPTDNPYKQDVELLPVAVRRAVSEKLRTEQIAQWMSDKTSLLSWLLFATNNGSENFDWALSKVPDSALVAYPEIAVESIQIESGMRGASDALWSALLKRKALDLRKAGNPAILNDVPLDAWPDLFARGHQITTLQNPEYPGPGAGNELDDWLMRDSATLKTTWPLMVSHLPNLSAEVIDRFLGSFGRSLPHLCAEEKNAITDADLERIETLLSLGATAHPTPLLKSCVANTKPEVYQRLVTLGVILPADDTPANPSKKRLVVNPSHCHFDPGASWLKALAAARLESLRIGSLQLLDLPNTDSCSLIVASGGKNDRMEMVDDFFKGLENLDGICGGWPLNQLWSLQNGALSISNLGNNTTENVVPLMDSVDHKAVYFVRDSFEDRCTSLSPGYLLATPDGYPHVLQPVAIDAPVADALRNQCGFGADIDECVAHDVVVYSEHPDNSDKYQISLDDFVHRYYAPQHTAYLAAINTFDVSTLSELQKNGVMPDWTLEAIDAVSTSTLSVQEKRRRTAWLFQDTAQLSGALDCEGCEHTNDVIIALGSWLPKEDWRPVIKALVANYPPEQFPLRFEQLANLASDAGNPELACRFDKVIKAKCPAVEVTTGSR